MTTARQHSTSSTSRTQSATCRLWAPKRLARIFEGRRVSKCVEDCCEPPPRGVDVVVAAAVVEAEEVIVVFKAVAPSVKEDSTTLFDVVVGDKSNELGRQLDSLRTRAAAAAEEGKYACDAARGDAGAEIAAAAWRMIVVLWWCIVGMVVVGLCMRVQVIIPVKFRCSIFFFDLLRKRL